MSVPRDYLERVYAGVLGKIIGVYLGRPFEGWRYERIVRELGEVDYYVHARLGKPLIVPDDDITGTFTFVRALPDNGNPHDLSAAQIGHTWLNYVIENRTVFWWGGMGESTEHTAYRRLKSGVEAPASGSAAANGRTVAEQIGAEIFIDGWAMVAPGDPDRAVALADRAARVSHDGEAVAAARMIAAMESMAFVEHAVERLIDEGLRYVPADSTIRRVVEEVRTWRSKYPDWRTTRELIDREHGYARYPGHVHVVPNFAVIMLALLYGEGLFGRSLMIANTAGWDTDCNSGNVGCLLGIRGGLETFDGEADWRGPVADRLYLPTADGGRAITDAVSEAVRITEIGRALAGEPLPQAPKGGARFHFDLPGASQGFTAGVLPPEGGTASLSNVAGHSARGTRAAALHFRLAGPGARARCSTATFIPHEALEATGYAMVAAPSLYSGQRASLRVASDGSNPQRVEATLFVAVYGAADRPEIVQGPAAILAAGEAKELSWVVPDTGGRPIMEVGILAAAVSAGGGAAAESTIYLDWLTWEGTPSVVFKRPDGEGLLWRRAWVSAFDHFDAQWQEAFRVSQDQGTGMLITGCREWTDYRVSSTVVSDLAEEIGIAARVQGLNRYYALVLTGRNLIELRKMRTTERVLAVADFPWEFSRRYALALDVKGPRIRGFLDGKLQFDVLDDERDLTGGGIALVCKEGSLATDEVALGPSFD